MPGVVAGRHVPAPREAGRRDQPNRARAPVGPRVRGQGSRRVARGPTASTRPHIAKEGWGGRAGRGGQLEDARLSESSQSTLTR